MRLLETSVLLMSDASFKGDEPPLAIPMKHLKFGMDFPRRLEHRKPLAKPFHELRREEITEPFADDLCPGVAQGGHPCFIHLDKAAVGIERLVTERSLLEQIDEALLTLPQPLPGLLVCALRLLALFPSRSQRCNKRLKT